MEEGTTTSNPELRELLLGLGVVGSILALMAIITPAMSAIYEVGRAAGWW